MRTHHIILGIVVVAVGATTSTAHADGMSIDLDRVVVAAPGSVVLLASRPVDASLIGSTCTADYTGRNNGSVHPDNDLIITSGSTRLELDGVEDGAGLTTSGAGQLVLGGDVTVSIRLGGDGVASLGASVDLTCAPPATTTAPTTTPATVAAGTDAPTTTAAIASTPTADTTTTTVALASAGPTISPTLPAPSAATTSPAALPSTGPSTDRLTAVALASVLTGLLLCLSRRRAVPGDRPPCDARRAGGRRLAGGGVPPAPRPAAAHHR